MKYKQTSKKYFNSQGQTIDYLVHEHQYDRFIAWKKVNLFKKQYDHAINSGYGAEYVIEVFEKKRFDSKKIKIDLEFSGKNLTPEENIRLEHTHQNLDKPTLKKLIELKVGKNKK